jgi:hypothetical protein
LRSALVSSAAHFVVMPTDRLNGGAGGGGGGQRGGSGGFPAGGQDPFEQMFKYELRLFELLPHPCLPPT